MKLTLLVFLSNLVTIIESLRCARLCAFVNFSLNSSIPLDKCQSIYRNNSECSVVVEIDHLKGTVSGRLSIQQCTGVPYFRTETRFKLNLTSVLSTVSYTCGFDNCDLQFIGDLFPLNWSGSNITSTEQEVNNLLYNPPVNSSNFQCINGFSCLSNSFCQANLTYPNPLVNNSDYNIVTSSSCVNISQTNDLLIIKQNILSCDNQTIEMRLWCNYDNCDDDTTVEKVFSLIHDGYISPLNRICSNLNSTFQCANNKSIRTLLSMNLLFFLFVSAFLITKY